MGARKKITVVGAGNVGATAAHWLAAKELGDVVLVDIVEGVPQGKALDLAEAAPVEGYDVRLIGTNGYDKTENSDVVIITAGLARKPGMSRDDLLRTNADIVGKVVDEIVKRSPETILIIVSNPLDAMCQVALRRSGLPKHRVIGMAGVLDSARMRCFLAEGLDVSVENVAAFVLGGHGDAVLPLPRYSACAGIAINGLLSKDQIEAIGKRRAGGGAGVDRRPRDLAGKLPAGCQHVAQDPLDRSSLPLYKGRTLTPVELGRSSFAFHHSRVALSSEKSQLDPCKQVAVFIKLRGAD